MTSNDETVETRHGVERRDEQKEGRASSCYTCACWSARSQQQRDGSLLPRRFSTGTQAFDTLAPAMGRLKCAAPRLVSSLAVGGRRVAHPVSPTRDERRVPRSSRLRIFFIARAPSAVHTPWPSCAGGWPGAGRGEERNLSRRRRKSAPTTGRSCPCGAGSMPGAGRGEEGNLSRRQRKFRPHDKSAS